MIREFETVPGPKSYRTGQPGKEHREHSAAEFDDSGLAQVLCRGTVATANANPCRRQSRAVGNSGLFGVVTRVEETRAKLGTLTDASRRRA